MVAKAVSQTGNGVGASRMQDKVCVCMRVCHTPAAGQWWITGERESPPVPVLLRNKELNQIKTPAIEPNKLSVYVLVLQSEPADRLAAFKRKRTVFADCNSFAAEHRLQEHFSVFAGCV